MTEDGTLRSINNRLSDGTGKLMFRGRPVAPKVTKSPHIYISQEKVSLACPLER
jgi:hypothetical protein